MSYNLGILITLILLLFINGNAQRSVSDLPRLQAAALKQFLTKHDDLQFLSETVCDQDVLKDMRKNFGAQFRPFYRTGDFNRDGVIDFAMILVKEGGPSSDQGAAIAETHRYLHDVTIVIFNGVAGTYKAAFVRRTKAPLVCFLNLTSEKKKRLTFGVYESDDGFIITPAGKGYIVE